MKKPLRVLIVEDSAEDAELLIAELRRGGYEPACERVCTADGLNAALDRQAWDIAFGDYSMPHFNGVAALKLLKERGIDLPFIFVSGTIAEKRAVEAMKSGAKDYVMKGNMKRLLPAIDRELREVALRRDHAQAEKTLHQKEEYFQSLIENSSDLITVIDMKGLILYDSPSIERILGYRQGELAGKNLFQYVPPDDLSLLMAGITQGAQAPEKTVLIEFRFRHRDGSWRVLESMGRAHLDPSGAAIGIINARDITERREAGLALKESEERLRMAINAARMYTWDWDVRTGRLIRSGHHQEMYGPEWPVSETRYASFLERVHPEDRKKFQEVLDRSVQGNVPYRNDFRIVRSDGEVRWLETQGQAYRDGGGRVIRMIGVTQDITERRQAEELIQHMAFYDTLTGLPNRNNLYDRILNTLRTDAHRGKPFFLLLMDLDRFKEINDTLGHHRGDILLHEVGARLKGVLFEPNLVARLGGDEFAILLPEIATAEEVYRVVQQIQDALAAPLIIEGLPIAVEASIGIALYPDHGENPESLLQRADVAMYMAKQRGRSHLLYDAQYDPHSHRRLALMGELRNAIDQEQLRLHFQPKIDLKTQRVIGVEALVRWQHPEQGFIPPDQFIGSAEKTGLIRPLTQWVLEAALRQCRLWSRSGMEIGISVNLSTRNLQESRLVERVLEALQRNEVAPGRLMLEITESAIMADPNLAREVLTRLSERGVGLSIDDFGTGYSSLAYLKRLPVDEIKIDKSFVLGMATDENDAVIVRSTIDLAHNLGLKVIAEGVENETLWEQLSRLGCDELQGYYISRPLPPEELSFWLNRSPWGFKKGQSPA
ncbi:MAG: EAL domain-containing protein [Nitrospirae bacterium]|nr:EAL domain-containing protein [Candidatus Manganitrophaceae bacterium]